jgi:hypothetical protein
MGPKRIKLRSDKDISGNRGAAASSGDLTGVSSSGATSTSMSPLEADPAGLEIVKIASG